MMLTQLQLVEVSLESHPAPRDPERERRLRGVLTQLSLNDENVLYGRTRQARSEDRLPGLVPGYRNQRTGELARSRYADGTPAPVHLLDGLPDHWIAERDADGRVIRARTDIEAGFLRSGRFYNRDEAARIAAH